MRSVSKLSPMICSAVLTAPSKFSIVTHWQQMLLLQDAIAPQTRLCSSSSLALCNAASSRHDSCDRAGLHYHTIRRNFNTASSELRRFAFGSRQTQLCPQYLPRQKWVRCCLHTYFCLSAKWFRYVFKQTANVLTPTTSLIRLNPPNFLSYVRMSCDGTR